MTIMDVVLPSEKERVKSFLLALGLKYEQNIDKSIYVEENDEIIGAVSASGCVIKCLAVDEKHRDDKLAVTLINAILERLRQKGIMSYQVFTKPIYIAVFESMNFRLLVQTDKVAMLEGGECSISESLDKIKVQMKYNLGIDLLNKPKYRQYDIACIVVNGNPFTNGHLSLVEYVASKHNFVLVFIVEEESSYFTFKERYALAYLALKQYKNVMVVPSTQYIVSRATFPSYFLADTDETTQQYAQFDAEIFAKYFMPQLAIRKRYIGSEVAEYMVIYNNTLKEVLGDKVEEVTRFTQDGNIISAKAVRKLIKEGKYEEAASLVPRASQAVFYAIIKGKNE